MPCRKAGHLANGNPVRIQSLAFNAMKKPHEAAGQRQQKNADRAPSASYFTPALGWSRPWPVRSLGIRSDHCVDGLRNRAIQHDIRPRGATLPDMGSSRGAIVPTIKWQRRPFERRAATASPRPVPRSSNPAAAAWACGGIRGVIWRFATTSTETGCGRGRSWHGLASRTGPEERSSDGSLRTGRKAAGLPSERQRADLPRGIDLSRSARSAASRATGGRRRDPAPRAAFSMGRYDLRRRAAEPVQLSFPELQFPADRGARSLATSPDRRHPGVGRRANADRRRRRPLSRNLCEPVVGPENGRGDADRRPRVLPRPRRGITCLKKDPDKRKRCQIRRKACRPIHVLVQMSRNRLGSAFRARGHVVEMHRSLGDRFTSRSTRQPLSWILRGKHRQLAPAGGRSSPCRFLSGARCCRSATGVSRRAMARSTARASKAR